MKTPNPIPNPENTRSAVARTIALALVTLVLQGCATAKTTWLRQDEPATVVQQDQATKETSPRTVLVSWTF